MTALPSDIAKFTTDGVEIERSSVALKAAFPNAADVESTSLEMFFDTAQDGYVLLYERFAMLSQVDRLHEAVEVAQGLGLGTTTPLFPAVPRFDVVDESRGIASQAVVRSIAYDMGSDRYSVELVGLGSLGFPATSDTTRYTVDSTMQKVNQTYG